MMDEVLLGVSAPAGCGAAAIHLCPEGGCTCADRAIPAEPIVLSDDEAGRILAEYERRCASGG